MSPARPGSCRPEQRRQSPPGWTLPETRGGRSRWPWQRPCTWRCRPPRRDDADSFSSSPGPVAGPSFFHRARQSRTRNDERSYNLTYYSQEIGVSIFGVMVNRRGAGPPCSGRSDAPAPRLTPPRPGTHNRPQMKINLRYSAFLLVSLLALGGCSKEPAPAAACVPWRTLRQPRDQVPAGRDALPARDRCPDLRLERQDGGRQGLGGPAPIRRQRARCCDSRASEPRWRPSESDWAGIKQRSVKQDAQVGDRRRRPRTREPPRQRASASGPPPTRWATRSSIARFPLPFIAAVQDPSRIRWRYGSIDSESAPPIVLEDLPVCGNCHSFSGDGSVLGPRRGLRQRQGRLRGPAGVAADGAERREDHHLERLSGRGDGEATFGLLSQVSPDGRYVISTVKDRAVFVATPDIWYSQLFFPIKGILVVYDTADGHLQAVAGRRRSASTCRATRPGAATASRSSSPGPRRTRGTSLANAKGVLLDEKDVPEFVKDKAAVQVRPVPGAVQRRARRQAGADQGRLAQRQEQLLRQVLAGRQVDRFLQGRELHAADAGQRALHHSGRGRRGPAPARKHAAHELLAQLVVERPLARLFVEGQHRLHASSS